MKHLTLYKTVRKQPKGRIGKNGKQGMVFLPKQLIGEKIKLTIELWEPKWSKDDRLHYPYQGGNQNGI